MHFVLTIPSQFQSLIGNVQQMIRNGQRRHRVGFQSLIGNVQLQHFRHF